MSLPDDLRRLRDESQVRLDAVQDLRQQYALIAAHSRRRMDASRQLLERRVRVDRV